MSKISQLHAELTEQAYDLGYKSLEDALDHGYIAEYEGGKLVPTEEIMKQAHEAWLAQKSAVLAAQQQMLLDIQELKETLSPTDYAMWVYTIKRTIEFIKKGEV